MINERHSIQSRAVRRRQRAACRPMYLSINSARNSRFKSVSSLDLIRLAKEHTHAEFAGADLAHDGVSNARIERSTLRS